MLLRAKNAERAIHAIARLSVCLSVRHMEDQSVGLLELGLCNFHRTLDHHFSFSGINFIQKF